MAGLFPIILVTHVVLAVGLFLPSILLPFALLVQLLRFSAEVQWANAALWVLLADTAASAALMVWLWLTAGGTARPQ